MKKILPLSFVLLLAACSNSSPYDGVWLVDAEQSKQSCEEVMMSGMMEELEDNPFAGLAAGFGSMVCGMVSGIIPILDIEENKLILNAFNSESSCTIDPVAQNLTCEDGTQSIPISTENEYLVLILPVDEDSPSMKIYYKKKL